MCPYQHGEVFVTDDGAETDLDLGHYERFTGVAAASRQHHDGPHLLSRSSPRSGAAIISARPCRSFPHVTDAIKEFITADNDDVDFVLCEIGGTVGDIEGLPFFEAIRQLGNELPRGDSVFIHLTLVPYIAERGRAEDQADAALGEGAALDRHPARHPALPLRPADPARRAAQDRAVLQCPRGGGDPGARRRVDLRRAAAYHDEGLDREVLAAFGITNAPEPDLERWRQIAETIAQSRGRGDDRDRRQIHGLQGRL